MLQGYFTRHNLRFRPSADHSEFIPRTDSNHSDTIFIPAGTERSVSWCFPVKHGKVDSIQQPK
jgi:hypothetical protein